DGVCLEPGAGVAADQPLVPPERRQQAAGDIVERHIVISGDRQHLNPAGAEALDEICRLPELAGAGALGEVSADDDQFWLALDQPGLECSDDLRIVCAKVNIGEVGDGCHDVETRKTRTEQKTNFSVYKE